MRENFHCRLCRTQSSFASRHAFAVPGSMPQYAPDRPVRLQHLLVEAEVDPEGGTLDAVATQRFRFVAPGQRRITLDQVDLDIREVTVDGEAARFSTEGKHLHIELPAEGPLNGDVLVVVRYSVRRPRRGLYFTGPEPDHPDKPYQVWSQCQDEDTHFWIPTQDYPNQKATTEIIATVPKGYTAVSNGALIEKKEEGRKTRFHYRLGMPHVTYLITLVVAKFSEISEQGPRGLPVQYFVEPGREEDAKRAFGNTPKMIRLFEEKTGVDYPYEKYSQAAVQDFIFGGMENTSATTQTDRVLHDERAHLDFSGDPLVSHELAHQWFGDLLTCRDWSHAWLNEGFATFMERVWVEGNVAEYGSPEAAAEEGKYYSYIDLKEYLSEDSSKYRRPIVSNVYIEPLDLFDRHLYQKGGLVLNLLRAQLGEEPFWKSVKSYIQRHHGGSVETLDLIRSIEETTGRNLRRFFDEWVFGAGHPELEVSYQWHDETRLAELVIEQKQTGGKPELTENGVTTHLFHLPVQVQITTEGGKVATHWVELGEVKDRVFIACQSRPLMVRFDPGHTIPRTMKFPRPREMLLYQLKNDADCMGRIEAVRELAAVADRAAVTALSEALQNDSFWGVQAEAAAALGEIRGEAARDALIEGLKVSSPKARRVVAKTLGGFKDVKAMDALRSLVGSEESYFVEADAVYAWAQAHPSEDRDATGDEFLYSLLEKESFLDVLRAGALRALGELPGVGRGMRPKALETLLEWTARGKTVDARAAAVTALARVMKTAELPIRARILQRLDEVADEENFRLRVNLVNALGATGLSEVAGVLEKIQRLDSDGRVKRDAMVTRSALLASAATPESLTQLKDSFARLEEEHRKLKAIVEELQAAGKAVRGA